MNLGFQDLIDISIDTIEQYSELYYAAKWTNGIEMQVYNGLITNNRIVLNVFKPYQIQAMKALLAMGYWIVYDDDIMMPCVRSLDYIFEDKVAVKHGAD